ncbi:MAG: hypothetical protein IJO57_02190 [Bacilli bacterium]|nr:hypothetical protein [Bacilli bacterium]
MKETTGEVSMTVVTLAAIGVLAAVIGLFWEPITKKIQQIWDSSGSVGSAPSSIPGVTD